jgi:hypothetical protein
VRQKRGTKSTARQPAERVGGAVVVREIDHIDQVLTGTGMISRFFKVVSDAIQPTSTVQ